MERMDDSVTGILSKIPAACRYWVPLGDGAFREQVHLPDDGNTIHDDIICSVPEFTLKDKTVRVLHASLFVVHPEDGHIYSQVRETFYGEGLEGVMSGYEMECGAC